MRRNPPREYVLGPISSLLKTEAVTALFAGRGRAHQIRLSEVTEAYLDGRHIYLRVSTGSHDYYRWLPRVPRPSGRRVGAVGDYLCGSCGPSRTSRCGHCGAPARPRVLWIDPGAAESVVGAEGFRPAPWELLDVMRSTSGKVYYRVLLPPGSGVEPDLPEGFLLPYRPSWFRKPVLEVVCREG